MVARLSGLSVYFFFILSFFFLLLFFFGARLRGTFSRKGLVSTILKCLSVAVEVTVMWSVSCTYHDKGMGGEEGAGYERCYLGGEQRDKCECRRL